MYSITLQLYEQTDYPPPYPPLLYEPNLRLAPSLEQEYRRLRHESIVATRDDCAWFASASVGERCTALGRLADPL